MQIAISAALHIMLVTNALTYECTQDMFWSLLDFEFHGCRVDFFSVFYVHTVDGSAHRVLHPHCFNPLTTLHTNCYLFIFADYV